MITVEQIPFETGSMCLACQSTVSKRDPILSVFAWLRLTEPVAAKPFCSRVCAEAFADWDVDRQAVAVFPSALHAYLLATRAAYAAEDHPEVREAIRSEPMVVVGGLRWKPAWDLPDGIAIRREHAIHVWWEAV